MRKGKRRLALRVYWPLHLRGTERSGNWGHKGRPGQVGGSAPGEGGDGDVTLGLERGDHGSLAYAGANDAEHDAMLQTLKDTLYRADDYGSTRFILPDGTRLGHDARTHAQAAHQVGVDLWEAMRGGLVRREGNAGVEAGSPITHAQAQHILDGALTYGREEVEVDIFFPDATGAKNSIGKTVEHRKSKTFRTDIESDTLRAWVNSHYRQDLHFFLLLGNERSGHWGHTSVIGKRGGSAPGKGNGRDVVAALTTGELPAVPRLANGALDVEAWEGLSYEERSTLYDTVLTRADKDRWIDERNKAALEAQKPRTEAQLAALPDKLKAGLKPTDSYGSTRFILPDGTRLSGNTKKGPGHDSDTGEHGDIATSVGLDLHHLMQAGVIRFVKFSDGGSGGQVAGKISHAQAEHLIDSVAFVDGSTLIVDLVKPGGNKVAATKAFDPNRHTADSVRTWINGHYDGTIPWTEELRVELTAIYREALELGSATSGNYGHAGRPGQVGGSAPGEGGEDVTLGLERSEARTFAGNEGYDWTEHDDRVQWASALPKADVDAINSYAGFGYGDINAHLRGMHTPRIVSETVRDATPEEIAAFEHPPMGHGGHADDYADDDPLNKVADGRIVHHFYYQGGYKSDDPDANKKNRVDTYTIEKAGPDEKRVKALHETADTINDSIRERGYVVPEAMSVNRAAYVPGLSYDELKSQEGGVMEEKGFTSTMVGNPSNRLDGYVMMGKSESIYKRTGGKSVESDEVGTAMRIEIVIPEGAKVAVVEPVRRIEYEYPRKVVPVPDSLKDDEWFKAHPETYTERDYTAKPTIKTDAIKDKGSRREAEILIGSGAQYRIVSVTKATPIHSPDGSMKPIEVVDVKLEYVGGGSSEGD